MWVEIDVQLESQVSASRSKGASGHSAADTKLTDTTSGHLTYLLTQPAALT